MKIGSREASELLGLSGETIRKMCQRGELTDYAPPSPGATRHYVRLDYDEVAALKRKMDARTLAPRAPAPTPAPEAPAAVGGVIGRLARLEEKVDRLLALWT